MFVLPVLAGVAAATAAPPQAAFGPHDPSITPVSLGERIRDIRCVYSGFESGPRGPVAFLRGRTYKASADTEGFRFIPFLGSSAPRNWPLELALQSVRVGGRDVALREGAVALDDGTITIDRGPASVRYESELRSVEQIFVLDGLGEVLGDVVVEVTFTTDLTLTEIGDTLQFEGPDGGVRMSRAVALDALGGRLEIPTEVDGATIRYRVPEAFASAAGGALRIDPVIESFTAADLGIDLSDPDVAYESDSNNYNVVFYAQFSGSDGDIYYVTLRGTDFTMVDDGFVELISGDAWRPRNCALADPGQFLVAYLLAGTAGGNEIYARSRPAVAGSSWGTTHLITGPSSFDEPAHHDIGGEAFEGSGSRAGLVWERRPLGGGTFPADIVAVTLDADASPFAPVIVLADSPATDYRSPAISKFTGDPIDHGAWYVAYASGPVGGTLNELRTTRLRFNGLVSIPNERVFSLGTASDLRQIDVSAPFATADITEGVMFAVNGFVGGENLSFVATRRSTALNGGSPPSIREIDINDALVTGHPSFATSSDEAVIAYNSMRFFGQGPRIVASSLEHERGGGIAVGERRTWIDTLATTSVTPISSTSRASGGGQLSSDDHVVVWKDRTTGNDDIFGALIRYSEPTAIGRNFCRGTRNSRDLIGFLAAFGDNTTLTNKDLVATGLPVQQFGLFVASRSFGSVFPGSSQGRLCLVGQVGRFNGSIVNSGPTGRFDFSFNPTFIPQGTGSVSAMAGETWGFQAWYRDSNPGSTSNFTSGVQIAF